MTDPTVITCPAGPQSDQSTLLRVSGLSVSFPDRSGLLGRRAAPIRAVDGVSLELGRGETMGLVGESGSGKTTVGRAILRLIEHGEHAAISGRAEFEGVDLLTAPKRELRRLRREVQIVFQDPGGSFNPRMRVADIVAEPMVVHGVERGRDKLRKAAGELLERCGMPASALDRYPHQFSGGQRQRIAVARALALHPKLIVCDEPTSALDVSVQAQILNLLRDLQRDLDLSYLFISHDMAVIHHMCDRIAVMRQGRIVEQGPRDRVLSEPAEEYTRELVAAVPKLSA